jgi:tRNA (guanosine-2'-O-)-methyltransferase
MMRGDPDTYPVADHSLLPAADSVILAALEPLLTDERRARIDDVIATRSTAVTAVLDGLIDPHNVSAVLRSADAFGVQHVHVIEGTEPFLATARTARGADRWVDVFRHATSAACVRALRERGHRIFVASMEGAVAPEALAQEPRVAIVFGNEHSGVSQELRDLADGTYAIPMCGFVQSLNVSVAAAITLFAAMRGRPGDLDAEAARALRARFVFKSVPQAEAIVEEYLRRLES